MIYVSYIIIGIIVFWSVEFLSINVTGVETDDNRLVTSHLTDVKCQYKIAENVRYS